MAEKSRNTIGKLLSLLKLEQKEIVSIYFYTILAGLLQLTLPLGIQNIVTFMQGGGVSTSLIILISFVIIGVGIVGILQLNVMRIIEKIQQQLFVRYSFSYAEVIPELDLEAADKQYLPELVNRFFDTAIVQKGIGKLLLDIPGATIQIFFGLILLSFYHILFLVFGVALSISLILLFRITGNAGIDSSLEESKYKYKVAAFLQEFARSISATKLHKDLGIPFLKLDKLVTGYITARTKHFSILRFQFSLLIYFKILITAAMLIIGAALLINNQLSIGQFIAAEIVIIMVINSVEKLIGNLEHVYDVLTAVEKVAEIPDMPIEPAIQIQPSISNDFGFTLTCQNLTYSYPSSPSIIENLTISVGPSEKIFIMGAMASGKTTFLKILAGLHSKYSGRLIINGAELSELQPLQLRHQINLLSEQQSQNIVEDTLSANLTNGKEYSTSDLEGIIQITGLTSFVKNTMEGLQMKLSTNGLGLSSGIIKRILLARALINPGALLLLDQPFQGLDTTTKFSVLKYIENRLPHTTVIVVLDETELVLTKARVFLFENKSLHLLHS